MRCDRPTSSGVPSQSWTTVRRDRHRRDARPPNAAGPDRPADGPAGCVPRTRALPLDPCRLGGVFGRCCGTWTTIAASSSPRSVRCRVSPSVSVASVSSAMRTIASTSVICSRRASSVIALSTRAPRSGSSRAVRLRCWVAVQALRRYSRGSSVEVSTSSAVRTPRSIDFELGGRAVAGDAGSDRRPAGTRRRAAPGRSRAPASRTAVRPTSRWPAAGNDAAAPCATRTCSRAVRCAMTAVVREPPRGRPDPEPGAALAAVELGDEQQPAARGRGQPPGRSRRCGSRARRLTGARPGGRSRRRSGRTSRCSCCAP